MLAIGALVMAALWTYVLVDALQANYDPDPRLAGNERRSLMILGALGIGGLVAAAVSGLAYVRTRSKTPIAGAVAGAVCAIPVLVVWIDLWEEFSGSD
ncbi:MAG: hypothetical protein ACR2GL_04595 [Thermoleophilaceae bacterium]